MLEIRREHYPSSSNKRKKRKKENGHAYSFLLEPRDRLRQVHTFKCRDKRSNVVFVQLCDSIDQLCRLVVENARGSLHEKQGKTSDDKEGGRGHGRNFCKVCFLTVKCLGNDGIVTG